MGPTPKNSVMRNLSHNAFARRLMRSFGKPRDVYDTLLPLHLVTKLLGLSPHLFKYVDGKPTYEASNFGSLCSITCVLAFIGYYVFAVQERNTISGDEGNKIAGAIDMYQLYGSVILMMTAVFANSFHQRSVIEATKEIALIDLKLSHQNLKINYAQSRNLIIAYILIVSGTFGIMEFMNCSMFLRQVGTLSTFCLLMCYIPMLVNGFLECQFVCYVLLLRQRFSALNGELHLLRRKKKYSSTGAFKIYPVLNDLQMRSSLARLTEVRKIHSRLCCVGKLLDKAFGFPMLFDITNNFINFTTLGFYSFAGCVKIYLEEPGANVYNTSTTGLWTLLKLTQLFVLSLICTLTKNEATLAGEIIYKMENRFEPEISSEIYSFGKQIMHWNFKFTAFGFFDIDMTLFYTAICSATTYLMILLQLDIANRKIENAFKNLQA